VTETVGIHSYKATDKCHEPTKGHLMITSFKYVKYINACTEPGFNEEIPIKKTYYSK
jgi:hypothetical protein